MYIVEFVELKMLTVVQFFFFFSSLLASVILPFTKDMLRHTHQPYSSERNIPKMCGSLLRHCFCDMSCVTFIFNLMFFSECDRYICILHIYFSSIVILCSVVMCVKRLM